MTKYKETKQWKSTKNGKNVLYVNIPEGLYIICHLMKYKGSNTKEAEQSI